MTINDGTEELLETDCKLQLADLYWWEKDYNGERFCFLFALSVMEQLYTERE